ncbi:hypothetical protein [Rubritalea tangerina]|uniref:hypothetical protein n=1 Tax=Rubritalea tangerina TaxID=430798 RepID=UPI003607E5A4
MVIGNLVVNMFAPQSIMRVLRKAGRLVYQRFRFWQAGNAQSSPFSLYLTHIHGF